MSLINDALKRARQAQQENATPPPDLPLRPAEPAQQRSSSLSLLPVAGLIVAVSLGGGFIFIALQKRNASPQVVKASQTELSPEPTPASVTPSPANPAPDVSGQPATAATTTTSPAPTTSAGLDATPTSTSVSPPTATPEAPVAVTPEPSKTIVPKLQGIFFNPSRPSAVVNGKTVYVGSRAGEARDFLVLEISRESVTVGNGSQTNVLILDE